MRLLVSQARLTRNFNSPHSVSQKPRLSSTTRYHICRLLRQPSDCESAQLLAFKVQLAANDCAQLEETLHMLYPDNADLNQVILQLDNLVYFYTSLYYQNPSSPNSTIQLNQIKQQIFQLLGFRE